jgi:hypothetical protein
MGWTHQTGLAVSVGPASDCKRQSDVSGWECIEKAGGASAPPSRHFLSDSSANRRSSRVRLVSVEDFSSLFAIKRCSKAGRLKQDHDWLCYSVSTAPSVSQP